MTTTSVTTRTGHRGNGTAVHHIVVPDNGHAYAACFAAPNMANSRSHQRITFAPEGTPVTCKTCAGPEGPAAGDTQHPDQCAQHPQSSVYAERQIKAGHKRTWTCGCTHLVRN